MTTILWLIGGSGAAALFLAGCGNVVSQTTLVPTSAFRINISPTELPPGMTTILPTRPNYVAKFNEVVEEKLWALARISGPTGTCPPKKFLFF